MFGTKLADGAESSVAAALPQSLGGLRVNVTDASGAVLAERDVVRIRVAGEFRDPAGLARRALVTVMRGGTVAAAIQSGSRAWRQDCSGLRKWRGRRAACGPGVVRHGDTESLGECGCRVRSDERGGAGRGICGGAGGFQGSTR